MKKQYLFCILLLVTDPAGADRLRVPSYLTCERNLVTSWTGTVTHYEREQGKLVIEMVTDADTFEQLTLELPTKSELQQHFYLDNQPFEDKNWYWLEVKEGELAASRSATVWLCLDNKTKPVINWIPNPRL